jgi:hypothetical protein
MPGLSRFDFYPRDWHLDTRDLSNAAKGIYAGEHVCTRRAASER